MKRIKCEIEGTTPLLWNKFSSEEDTGARRGKKYKDDEEAEKRIYRLKDGDKKSNVCIPSMWIYRAMIKSAGFYKTKGRATSTILAGTIRIEPEGIDLGTNKYEMDKQAVVVQKARIMRVRPRLSKWKATFEIVYNEKYYADADLLKQILEEAGERIGIGDGRPSKSKLWYGCFKLNKFEEQE